MKRVRFSQNEYQDEKHWDLHIYLKLTLNCNMKRFKRISSSKMKGSCLNSVKKKSIEPTHKEMISDTFTWTRSINQFFSIKNLMELPALDGLNMIWL